jgi:hypothetical protein
LSVVDATNALCIFRKRDELRRDLFGRLGFRLLLLSVFFRDFFFKDDDFSSLCFAVALEFAVAWSDEKLASELVRGGESAAFLADRTGGHASTESSVDRKIERRKSHTVLIIN